jgi:hypothetical protein
VDHAEIVADSVAELYRGEISYKGEVYPGEHEAIVDEQLWDAVQATLAANRVERATGARAKSPSLLTGMVFDETGERLTPTHAVKKGARYRYYVSTSLVRGGGKKRPQGRRIPAGDLERVVIENDAAIPAIVGSANTRRYSGSWWLSNLDSNQSMHFKCIGNRGKFPGGRGSQRLESVIQAMNDSAAA